MDGIVAATTNANVQTGFDITFDIESAMPHPTMCH